MLHAAFMYIVVAVVFGNVLNTAVRSFFLQDGWVWVDIATLLLQVVGIFLWAECINSISASAFAPRTVRVDFLSGCPSSLLRWSRLR